MEYPHHVSSSLPPPFYFSFKKLSYPVKPHDKLKVQEPQSSRCSLYLDFRRDLIWDPLIFLAVHGIFRALLYHNIVCFFLSVFFTVQLSYPFIVIVNAIVFMILVFCLEWHNLTWKEGQLLAVTCMQGQREVLW